MPRKKQPYTPIVFDLPDGSQHVHTGIIQRKQWAPSAADIDSLIELSREAKRTGQAINLFEGTLTPEDTPETYVSGVEQLALKLLRPHIATTPMTADEVRSMKKRIASKSLGSPFVYCDVGDGLQHYEVRPESRLLPIIHGASEVLRKIRAIRKKGTFSFLAGVQLGSLCERMLIRNVEPQFIGVIQGIKANVENAELRKQAGQVNAQAIYDQVKADLERQRKEGRESPKLTVAYLRVAQMNGCEERAVANAYRKIRGGG